MSRIMIVTALMLMPVVVTAAASFPVVEVTRDVLLLPGQLQPDRSPDGNSEVLRGPNGLIVIDTGRGGDHTQELIDVIKSMKLPLTGVINTHWHLDHIGGNALFKQTWPALRIYAHPSLDHALTDFHADYRHQLESYVPTLPIDSAERKRYEVELDLLRLDRALAETDPVDKNMILKSNGRKLEVHVSAHSVTEGDLWVYDPAAKILIAGDLVTLPVPLFDSACPEGWQHALDVLSKVKFKTLIPGHGNPMHRAQFEQYHSAFTHLLNCAAHPDNKQQCINNWFTDARSLIDKDAEAYGRVLLSYYFDQFIKTDASGRKKWCSDT